MIEPVIRGVDPALDQRLLHQIIVFRDFFEIDRRIQFHRDGVHVQNGGAPAKIGEAHRHLPIETAGAQVDYTFASSDSRFITIA